MATKGPVQYIASSKKLLALLAQNGNKPVAVSGKIVGIHFQFTQEEAATSEGDRVVAIAIGNDLPTSTTVVLHVNSLKRAQVVSSLKTLLQEPAVVKVLFDVERVARWLHRYGMHGVTPTNCVDLQLLYQVVTNSTSSNCKMNRIVSQLGGKSSVALAEEVAEFHAKLKPLAWTKSPLAPHMVQTLAKSMRLHARCYHGACGIPGATTHFPRVNTLTSERWGKAVTSFSVLTTLAETNTSSSSESASDASASRETNSGPLKVSDDVVPAANALSSSFKLIATDSALQNLFEKNNYKFVSTQTRNVGVHFQFAKEACQGSATAASDQDEPDQLVAMAIASDVSDEPAVVLQLGTLSKQNVVAGLQILLGDHTVIKVMHNIHRAAFWFHSHGLQDIKLVNCFDLQLHYESTIDSSRTNADILQIAAHTIPDSSEILTRSVHSFKAKVKPVNAAEWKQTPLSATLLQTLAQTTKLYSECYVNISPNASLKASWAAMTNSRWQNSVVNRGCKAIWFDPATDNQARSLECLLSSEAGDSGDTEVELKSVELQCDLDPLLDLLPSDYQEAIISIEDYQTKLVDVCLDVGRIPYVYIGKKQRIVLSDDNEVVTKDTIDEIILNIGGEMAIGDDNRAGIDRQLHRISVMRSKTGEVYGLTMRVGRALRNAACVLTDLLLSDRHADKSVLVLGHPGSGKTTLIRDVARCVSETMENVCIIDTSNEIGGDGLVPHACVGWARRMMVKSLEAQASVMVECVQNHTVETLIVDEIGRKAEVLAASTVRQRGPRLIASAHGDFRALMKNPDLKGLVGGSQQVTVGDSAAAQSASKSKLQTQRAGNPIFDVIVELDHVIRGRCRIIWDVAKAVDSVFEGDKYSFETRQWDANTRGVQVPN